MAVFTAMTPESVHLGDKHIGALLAGDKLVYNRVEEWRKTTPGTLAMDIPEWASFMSIFISGGGAGGGYGVTGEHRTSYGGGAGEMKLETIDLVANPGRRARVNIGAGGAGRGYSRTDGGGSNGSVTRFMGWNSQSNWSAAGGTTRNDTAGEAKGWNSMPENHARWLNRTPGSRYYPQTGGAAHDRTPGNGRMGGGGGQKTSLAGSGTGGRGGDGFAIIHFFGIDPMTPRLTGGSAPPDTEPQPGDGQSTDRGEWAADTHYRRGDTYTYQGKRYRVKQDHESNSIRSPQFPLLWKEYFEEI